MSETHKGIDFGALGAKGKHSRGDNHLLVIAIDAYEHCPELSNCVKDARDFAALMQEHYHFKADHIYTLYNEKATRANVLRELKALRSRVGEQDNLIIYFSGHGEVADEEAYWVPVEGKPSEDWDWIPADRIKRQLNAVNSFHTLVIVDACFSGSFFLSYKSSTRELLQSRRSRLGISASHSRERALDGQAGENSPFARELLRILRYNQQPIPVDQLFTQVRDAVASRTKGRQTPILKNIDVKGDDQGQFVFTPEVDEATAWKRSKQEHSISAYQGFLEMFPQSSYAEEARQQLKILQEKGSGAGVQRGYAYGAGADNKSPVGRKWILLGLVVVLAVIGALVFFGRGDGSQGNGEANITEFEKLEQEFGQAIQDNDLLRVEEVKREFSTLNYDSLLINEKIGEIDEWIIARVEFLKFPQMIKVPGGVFSMGCLNESRDGACEEEEKPVHEVTISGFSISRTEVTNRQFAAFLNAEGNRTIIEAEGEKKAVKYISLESDGYGRKSRISEKGGQFVVEEGYEEYPANFVTWPGAIAYTEWLSEKTGENYRLPTEAEWEYAARGGETGKKDGFLYSGSDMIDEVAWYLDNSNNSIHAVASKRPNQLGLFDMSGNLREWCEDHHESNYLNATKDGTARKMDVDKGQRIIRGGGYNKSATDHRVASRAFGGTSLAYNDVGFRVVKE